MQQKLDALNAEFRGHYHNVVDLTDTEDSLTREQDVLDEHDDLVAELSVTRLLAHVRKTLFDFSWAIGALSGDPDDTHRLHQHGEQLGDLKKELWETRSSLLILELGDSDDLRKLSSSSPVSVGSSPAASDSKGVKLPKLDVPTFDGNILNWHSFWEQFRVSVHDRSTLSASEELVYLQHSLKDGSTNGIIEGLSRSSDYHSEAVECLQAHSPPKSCSHDIGSTCPQGWQRQVITSFAWYGTTAPLCS